MGPERFRQMNLLLMLQNPKMTGCQAYAAGVALVVQLCSMLAMWLHVKANVGRATVNTVLKALQLIISTTVDVIRISLAAQGVEASLPNFNIPADIRSIHSRFNLDPPIQRTVCCPKCYKLYSGELADIPLRCTYRQSPRAKPCNAELRRKRRTRTGGVKDVPHTMFSTQLFDPWLEFFLGRHDIDAALDTAVNRPPVPPDGKINDLRDSKAWADLGDYTTNKYNLVFGLYIDWFNPYTNKVAGKVVSCGAVALVCLNLPPEIRYRRENIFIIGLIPSPNHPDAITIPHVLDPLIDTILNYDIPGKLVETSSHPEGINVCARIIPLIADLVAARQVAGFLSHAANKYCWYCTLEKDENHDLAHTEWTYRTGEGVRADAAYFSAATTKAERNKRATETGVRPSSLHRFGYWNPVKHTILGFMHNWYEGVLKFHLRTVWGVGRSQAKEAELVTTRDLEAHTEINQAETASEASDLAAPDPYEDPAALAELRRNLSSAPSDDSDATPRAGATSDDVHMRDVDEMDVDSESASESAVATPRETPALSSDDEDEWEETDEEVDDDEMDEYTGTAVFGNFKLSKPVMEDIRTCIREVSLPTWASRLPDNLGEKKHGKLKADQYYILFSAILPLVVPELDLVDDADTSDQMLDGFYHLVAASNIASSFETSDAEAAEYLKHFLAYRRNTQNTYPDVIEPPNLHYAIHAAAQMMYWGSGPGISEFWGERLNGDLQKIKTNKRLSDMDFTMLRQMTRRCRLLALLHSQEFENPALRSLAQLLEPSASALAAARELSDAERIEFLSRAPRMSTAEYKTLLQYLNCPTPVYVSWLSWPDRDHHSMILPPNAKRLREYHEGDRTYSCQTSHSANSLIQFRVPNDGTLATGVIDTILEVPLHGFLRKFLLVRRHRPLDISLTPYAKYPRFMTGVVAAEPYKSLTVIEPKHVLTHLSAWARPANTYTGIREKFLVVCWALNRGRK
ncbi:hypothetical protein MKEN_01022800 [Mycena kentingensis (nom. inval.)]|nr:hypothetical protein MKEN_01022800 [Mycena kentingensis (nom. inval.)]